MKLKKPDMNSYMKNGVCEITSHEPEEFIAHCDNIAHILANTVFMWNANRKIRRYLELTGADVE